METKLLSLIKGAQRFYFRYELGHEEQLRQALMETVGVCGFDWYDAAVLFHQVNSRATQASKDFMKEGSWRVVTHCQNENPFTFPTP